jgi:hypothetical protein
MRAELPQQGNNLPIAVYSLAFAMRTCSWSAFSLRVLQLSA